jgi:predicted glutamine amidotransferase
MCQLLGMNCAAPTDFSFSLKGFCQRGGQTDKHSHGWGAAIYEGRGLRCFHDTLPACQSPIAELMQQYPIRTYVRCSTLLILLVANNCL